jgi:fibronectin type 3 domain-containing protein
MAYVLNTIIINNSATTGGADICNYSNVYAYYSWYDLADGTILTQAGAPNMRTAYDGSVGSLAINIPGTTRTMAVASGTAAGTGIFAYNTDNTPAGYYFRATDGNYHQLTNYSNSTAMEPSGKITTDQRGVTRSSPAYIGSYQPSVPVTVTSNANSGAGTLRQAIADTSEGDTVVFSLSAGNETISIASELNISGKSLIIDGSNTAGSGTAVTVQVTAPGSSPWRAFYLNPGPGKTVSISKMTIKGGDISGTGFGGGCIYFQSGTLQLNNSTLSGAKAFYGGGIYKETGTATVTSCTISGNTASHTGGGICNDLGTATITSCTISGNTSTADGGGGIYNGGTATITSCTISGNTTSGVGGGIRNDGTAYVLKTIIINNSASSGGADIRKSGLGIFYAYYSWYNLDAGTGTISTQADAPNMTTAYTTNDLLGLANFGGLTNTMPLNLAMMASDNKAVGKGTFAYNTDDTPVGYYFRAADGNYHQLTNYSNSTAIEPPGKIITDQRGATQSSPPCIGSCTKGYLISGGVSTTFVLPVFVPSGKTKMALTTTGGSGDCDLYLCKPGDPPSIGTYYEKSTNEGTVESVTVLNPEAGGWVAIVYGYAPYSNIFFTGDTFTDGPGVPSNLAATPAETAITLTWEASSGATSYDIYRSKVDSSDLAELVFPDESSPKMDYTAVAGTTYYYWVKAKNAAAESAFSAPVSGWLTRGVPTVITKGTVLKGISGIAGSTRQYTIINVPAGQLLLEVKTFGGTGDSDLSVEKGSMIAYGVKTTDNEIVQIQNPSAGTYIISLYANTAYSGLSLVANYYNAKPATPTSVTASKGKYQDAILVSWKASAGASIYQVFRSELKAIPPLPIAETADQSYMDPKDAVADLGKIFNYWVKARNNAIPGSSAPSAMVSGYISSVPVPPSSVTASKTHFDKIIVTWPKVAGAISYSVYRSVSNIFGTATLLNSVPYDSNAANYVYNDTCHVFGGDPAPDFNYYYWVVSKNDNGSSTGKISKTTGCIAKAGPSTIAASQGTLAEKIRITWSAVAGATDYEVTDEIGSSLATVSGLTYDHTVVDTVKHSFKVRANLNIVYQSDFSKLCEGYAYSKTLTTLPAPVIKSASKGEYPYVKLTWSEVRLAITYNIYRKLNPGDGWGIPIAPGISSLSYDDMSASPDQPYWYCIEAVNGSLTSARSTGMSGYAAGSVTHTIIGNSYSSLSLIGAAGNQRFYEISIPAGVSRLVARAENVTGSCELYAKLGCYPTSTKYNAKGVTIAGTSDKVLTVTNPTSGTWYISLCGTGTTGYANADLSIDYYTSTDIIFTQVPANDQTVPFTAVFKGKVLDRDAVGIKGLTIGVRDPLTGLEKWLTKTDAKGYFSYSTIISGEGEYTYDFFFTEIPDGTRSIGSWTVKTKKSPQGVFDFAGYLNGPLISEGSIISQGGTISGLQTYMNVRRGFSPGPADSNYEDLWVENTLGVASTNADITAKLDPGLYFLLYGTEGAALGNGMEAMPGLVASPLLVRITSDTSITTLATILSNMPGGTTDSVFDENVTNGGIGVVVLTAVKNSDENPVTGAGYDISLYADQQLELLVNLAGDVAGTVTVVGVNDKKYGDVITSLLNVKIDGGARMIGVRFTTFSERPSAP